jgi:hypothetical protein
MATSPFDGTVAAMSAVTARARANNDRIGEFAAMYTAVTRRVRHLAEEGAFADADRMAAFVERFAARFLDAVAARDAQRPVTKSWSAAFTAAREWRPGVLQNLLLGMTAHIGLDLGVVAADVATGPAGRGLQEMRPDFDAINDVLASLVPNVESAVGRLSPGIALLDKAGGRADAFAVARVIAVARDLAWRNATELTTLNPAARVTATAHMDTEVSEMSRLIAHPGPIMSAVLLPIRLRERRSLAESIDVLGNIDNSLR